MRSIMPAIAAVLVIGLLTPSVGFAAPSQTAAQKRQTQDRVKNPRSFDACVQLALQRGLSVNDNEYRAQAREFVRGCMQGKYH
jgi:hypothetical protein